MRKQNLIGGTIFLVIISAIVKAFGLVNRFILARLLTPDGFSIYMLVMPTFLLVITLAQLGFPTSISKLVSENKITKHFTNKQIILSALKITLVNSLVIGVILYFSAHFLAGTLLHDGRAYLPLLALICFVPFVSFSNILRGYFNGLKNYTIPGYAQLVEQVIRIFTMILFIIILRPYGIHYAVAGSLLALTFGELASIVYMIIRIYNRHTIPYLFKPNVSKYSPTRDILNISLPVTGSRLIGSFAHFLEPIVFTTAMISLGISSNYTTRLYGQIQGYVINTILTPSFIVLSICTTFLPYISELYAKRKMDKIADLFHQALYLSFISCAIYLIIITLYPIEVMKIFYGTTEGTQFLRLMSPIFILYFFEAPLAQTLTAIDQEKKAVMTTLFCSTLKIALIYVLVRIRSVHVYGLILAIVSNVILIPLINYLILKKHLKLKVNWKLIITLMALCVSTFVLGLILKQLAIHFIIQGMIVGIFYCFILWVTNLGNIRELILSMLASRRPQQQ